jgi:hypothetical protein
MRGARLTAVMSEPIVAFGYPLPFAVYRWTKLNDGTMTSRILDPRVDSGLSIWTTSPALAEIRTSASRFELIAKPINEDRYVGIMMMMDGVSGSVKVLVRSSVNDADGDGIPNKWELLYGLNPLDPLDGGSDPDGDGLTNLQEFQRGTNPLDPDTDHDGIPDNIDPEPLTPETISPTIVIVAPAIGEKATKDHSLNIHVTAQDNAAVSNVSLSINGVKVSFALGCQLVFSYVPVSLDSILLEATAADVTGNSTSMQLSVPVQEPSNNLVVRGRVLNADGSPHSGAEAYVAGFSGVLSDLNGNFSIEVPMENASPLTRVIIYSIDAGVSFGAFAVLSTPGSGELNFGDLTLQQQAFESNLGVWKGVYMEYGQFTGSWKPHSLSLPLSYSFPFYNGSYSSLSINANGEIALGNDSTLSFWPVTGGGLSDVQKLVTFGSGSPRMAPLWSVLNVTGRNIFQGDGKYLGGGPSPFVGGGVYSQSVPEGTNLTWFMARVSGDLGPNG